LIGSENEAFMSPSSTTTQEQQMATKLSATQERILHSAASRADGNIEPLPPNVQGGARKKVVDALVAREFVRCQPDTDGSTAYWRISEAGLAAIGKYQIPAITEKQERQQAAKRLIKIGVEGKPRNRDNSKQATVIGMLKRPEGATIPQICEATGWQQNTVRGTFAGAFKKKLGLTIVSDKPQGAERIYRIGA
jgi:hypothetical protein